MVTIILSIGRIVHPHMGFQIQLYNITYTTMCDLQHHPAAGGRVHPQVDGGVYAAGEVCGEPQHAVLEDVQPAGHVRGLHHPGAGHGHLHPHPHHGDHLCQGQLRHLAAAHLTRQPHRGQQAQGGQGLPQVSSPRS